MQSESRDKATSARRKARAERQKRLSANDKVNLTKEDWLQAALEVLNKSGIDAVKVLPLSKGLGVTRGSFYWHFADRNELLREMLEYWERDLTDSVMDQAKAMGGSPQQRLDAVLTNVLINRQNRYDTAIAAWGMFDKHVFKFYSRVVRKRLRFLKSLMLETGLSEEKAAFRARLLFAFVATYALAKPRASAAERLKDVNRCKKLALAR